MDRESELGGLWLKTSNAGKKYMSGRFNIDGQTVEVVVFKNERKQPGEKTPDYRVYRSQPRDGAQQPQQGRAGQQQRRPVDDLDDEIPF